MTESCEGKVVIITGASSGIGAETAREFTRRGAKVALLARREDRIKALVREIEVVGRGEAMAVVCDVRDSASLERAFAAVRERFGWADIVVANAGFGVVGNFEELSIEDYERQMETNVTGVLRTIKAGLSDLKRMQGRLVIIGSIKGYFALAGSSAYSMSKFAVRGLSLSLRLELAPYGISVTHIAPGYIETEFRNVDNRGAWHRVAAREVLPSIFKMSAHTAARQIVVASMKRKSEAVITWHGKAVVWLSRHLPGLFLAVLDRAGVKTRKQAGG